MDKEFNSVAVFISGDVVAVVEERIIDPEAPAWLCNGLDLFRVRTAQLSYLGTYVEDRQVPDLVTVLARANDFLERHRKDDEAAKEK